MPTLFFALAVLIAALLISAGVVTPEKWLFGVGSVLLVVALIVSLNPGGRKDRARRSGH